MLGQAVEATKSLDHGKLAAYMQMATFDTVVGKVKFGRNGEWARSRTLMVQFRDVQPDNLRAVRQAGEAHRGLSQGVEVGRHRLPVQAVARKARAMLATADLLANAVAAGILLGGFYAAVAIGLAIVFGQLDIVNIAHPAFIIVGAYIAWIVNTKFGFDPS